jgi:hypothetical protein
MNISRHIIPEIYNYDNKIKEIDTYRILNSVDIEKVHKHTTILYKPNIERNILYIPNHYKNFMITIELSNDIDIELDSPILEDCSFIIEYDKYDKYDKNKFTVLKCMERLINFLKLLPANTKSINISSICSTDIQQDIIQYLPRNLKKYYTLENYIESLDNLPPSLEFLSVYSANVDYSYAFLPLTLHTLDIKGSIVLPELANLPPGLKVLSLDYYKYNLATLPEGLETLIITNYYYLDTCTEIGDIPPNLKTLQFCSCKEDTIDYRVCSKKPSKYPEYGIKKYPIGLEHLDIDCKVDITKLPLTLKSLGLYGFELSSNIIQLPENITTIYTNDDYIEYLPSHIKRVIIINNGDCCGVNSARVQVGDVIFEMSTYNIAEYFMIK